MTVRVLRIAPLAIVGFVGSSLISNHQASAGLLRAAFRARPVLQLLRPAAGLQRLWRDGGRDVHLPRPTPPLVGHTYITYQPLMPHEFLYRHHRCYYRDNGPYAGVTKTWVCWW